MSYDIVVFVPSEWRVVHSLPENTAINFARAGHRVLIAEPMYTASSVIRTAALQKRRIAGGYGLRQEDERIWIYRPPPIGIPGRSRSPTAARLTGFVLGQLVRRACHRLGFQRPVAWTYLYDTATALSSLGGDLTVYECGDQDEALAVSDGQRHTVRLMEAETCRRADLVVCCTDELAVQRRRHNPRTATVHCAADVAFFRRSLLPETAVPADIAALDGPVIGYMGGLDPWKIDVDLIRGLARARPAWSLALVGYIWFGFDPSVFADLPNVHVLGPKDYAAFPGYLKGMDVGLLPFPDNDITRNGDALKAYEYLAAGLPVVGRPVPVARRLAPLVRLAVTVDDFVTQIEAALDEDDTARAERREAIAAHDWSVRVADKLALIEATLAAKHAPP
jgi:glycosyltransferase involved in cell wall biosynthesis